MSGYLNRLMQKELQGMESVLDLGCGSDSQLRFVQGVSKKVGVDAFEPSIEKARAKGIHDEYLIMPLDQIDIPDKSFDAVIAIDLVEHFEKDESRAFIAKMESLAKKKVFLFTPNGFLPQPSYDNNPWQEHKCGWEAAELQDMGYHVQGVLGFKWMRGLYHRPYLRPRLVGNWIANRTRDLWTAKRPHLDAGLVAVKTMGDA